MAATLRRISKGGVNRAQATGLSIKTNVQPKDAPKALAMRSSDWRKTAHSLTSCDSHSHDTSMENCDPRDAIRSDECHAGRFSMRSSAIDQSDTDETKETDWEVVMSAPINKSNSFEDDFPSFMTRSSHDSTRKEYVQIDSIDPWTFRLGDEEFVSKKISIIQIRLLGEDERKSRRSCQGETWPVVERLVCSESRASGELSIDQDEAVHREKEAMELMSTDPAIDEIVGIRSKSPHKRKAATKESKTRFHGLISRLKPLTTQSQGLSSSTQSNSVNEAQPGDIADPNISTAPPSVLSISSISSRDSNGSTRAIRGSPSSGQETPDVGASKSLNTKLNPAAAEFKTTVNKVLGPPIAFPSKKYARPALGNIFPEAAHLGLGHSGYGGNHDGSCHPISGPVSFQLLGSGRFPTPPDSQAVSPVDYVAPNWSQGSCNTMTLPLPWATPPMDHAVPHVAYTSPSAMHQEILAGNSHGGLVGPEPMEWQMARAHLSEGIMGGNAGFNTFPSHGHGAAFLPHTQGPPGRATMPNQTPFVPAQNDMAIIPPSAQADATGTNRPYFPVTKKPRGNNTWAQMEYERYLEWRKANEPGYHMSCKFRQANRFVRRYNYQHGDAA